MFTTQERNYGQPVHVVPGQRYGPLRIQSVAPERVECSDADAHLAFTAIFETDAQQHVGTFTTEVRFKDTSVAPTSPSSAPFTVASFLP